MNVFLACVLAVLFVKLLGGAARFTFARFIDWRWRRQAGGLPVVPFPVHSLADIGREISAREDAKLALEIAADSYAMTPCQGTLDELTACAAAFGKTQDKTSREMRLRYAEYRQRIRTP